MTAMPRKTTTKPRRRWLAFSLRTLQVVVLLTSVPLVWVGKRLTEARKQREAARAIQKLGGRISCEPAVGDMIGAAVAWAGTLLGEDLTENVIEVRLVGAQAGEDGLKNLPGLARLRQLYLDSTQVTDASLERLEGLRRLQTLFLMNTRITDAGLERLKGLTELRTLHLQDTQVTDTGLAHLDGLAQLQWLNLEGTRVTCVTPVHLEWLTQL
jgi:hypothetical protein